MANAKDSKELHDIHLDGFSDVKVSVYQPYGGRYVCEITIETSEHRIVLYDMHCDVAWTLRNALNDVLREFGMT